MTKISGALLLCATTVLVPAGLLADNGARATAHIIEGITVDGLFGDWPEGLPTYSITEVSDGYDVLSGPEDSDGSFRVAYDPDEGALYLAISWRDESRRLDGAVGGNEVRDLDGCEIYLTSLDADVPGNYALLGTVPLPHAPMRLQDMAVAMAVIGNRTQYEWRIAMAYLVPQFTVLRDNELAFDVALTDPDEDGSYSWISWGPGGDKHADGNRLGRVNLSGIAATRADDPDLGRLKASILWPNGLRQPRTWLTITPLGPAQDREQTKVYIGDDPWADVQLPPGQYRLVGGLSETPAVTATVEAGKVTTARIDYQPIRERVQWQATALAGETIALDSIGTMHPAGSGRRVGSWQVLGLADGLPDATVNDILQDADGSVWFASRSGVTHYGHHRDQVQTISARDGLCGESVRRMARDGDGALWFACGGFSSVSGLARLDASGLTDFTASLLASQPPPWQGTSIHSPSTVVPAAEGGVWSLIPSVSSALVRRAHGDSLFWAMRPGGEAVRAQLLAVDETTTCGCSMVIGSGGCAPACWRKLA